MWILLALTSALCISISNVAFKYLVNKKTHWALVALASSLAVIPFLIVALAWYWPIRTDGIFWMSLAAGAILNIFAWIFAFRTLDLEDASFLAPLAAFSPLMTTIISRFTLGEVPSVTGLVGTVCIGIGASFLGRVGNEKLYISLLSFFRRKSVRYMMGAYLIWAITPTFEKTALIHSQPSNPALLSLGSNGIIALGMTPLVLRVSKNPLRQLKKIAPVMVLVGGVGTIGQLAAFTAYTLTNVSYVSALLRTSILFTSVIAAIFLKERVEKRILAIVLMFAGVILITL